MKKILVIEDDPTSQKIYHTKLLNEGFEVNVASNGSSGLTILAKNPPNLIVLDIMLVGNLNGFDILEKIKKDPKTKKIPVLVLTNLSTEEKVAKEIGAEEYLIKANTSIEEVVAKIKSILKE
jgi:DNA-binding response OmpR family regulator